MAQRTSKKVTSSDVAALAGVSQTTVSLVMNHHPGMNLPDETRERVLAAARQLGYQPPVHKKKNKKDKLILVMIPTLTNQYYAELVQALEQYCDSIGYRTLLCNTFRNAEMEKFYLDKFSGDNISGIIYAFLPSYPDAIEELSARVPIVLVGEKKSNLSICSIELANKKAGATIAEHLFSLGHRNITFISTPIQQMTLSRSQRLDGLRRRMSELGDLAGEKCSVTLLTSSDVLEQDALPGGIPYEYYVGQSLTRQLLSDGTVSTALVGVNDMIALGIMDTLKSAGVRIPDEMSVCGFDNIFTSAVVSPGLTTIDHSLNSRCRSAVGIIVEQSNTLPSSWKNGNGIADKIEYTPLFVQRGSTGPVPFKQE